MSVFKMTFTFLIAFFWERLELAAENLALRQQLATQQRSANHVHLDDRSFGNADSDTLVRPFSTFSKDLALP